ncbi:MAG: DUF3168 domain-containing protein [Pseudomonadota bacterium]
MSMAFAAPLQTALYATLTGAPELASVAGRIFDDAPHGSTDVSEPYVTIGDEDVSPWNTATEVGAIHEVEIRIYSPVRGFLSVKEIAGSVCEVLCGTAPLLTRGRIVTHEFTGAETKREEQGALRRISLTFRFVIEDTQ